jgi:chitosanase
MLTNIQKKTAQAIVNIFETGSVHGEYGQVTVVRNDAGHLTYGRSQTTLASGNLYLLVKAYCEAPGALFAGDLNPYLSRLATRDLALDNDAMLRNVLHDAGGDPVMHDVQNQFFDSVYWKPAAQSAANLGFKDPLSTAVVYDSCIHGSWQKVRDMTNAQFGAAGVKEERPWIENYVKTRKNWLGSSPNPLLQRTVYRMESFEQMIASALWDLRLPLRVRGVAIDADALEERTPVVASADDNTQRTLHLTTPLMSGKDVESIQTGLKKLGITVENDGVFGQETDTAVRTFQRSKGLKPDGVVGPATRASLGL